MSCQAEINWVWEADKVREKAVEEVGATGRVRDLEVTVSVPNAGHNNRINRENPATKSSVQSADLK